MFYASLLLLALLGWCSAQFGTFVPGCPQRCSCLGGFTVLGCQSGGPIDFHDGGHQVFPSVPDDRKGGIILM